MDYLNSVISLSSGMKQVQADAQREVSVLKKALDTSKGNFQALLNSLNSNTGSSAAKAVGLGKNLDLFA